GVGGDHPDLADVGAVVDVDVGAFPLVDGPAGARHRQARGVAGGGHAGEPAGHALSVPEEQRTACLPDVVGVGGVDVDVELVKADAAALVGLALDAVDHGHRVDVVPVERRRL